ncbi:hypothetical protein [Pseudokordiimonas caeni]|uniref:hypothetical protein n=1 Tax=Pseudokordiimonas caeni TaxID=2997908 RepID=UPI002812208D|nr:hypothetical protein [Pseudokordiimonas caeni]
MADPVLSYFETPRRSLRWAREDIDRAIEQSQDFLQRGALQPVMELNPVTGDYVWIVKRIGPAPDFVLKGVTHAILDIRHSLDQSMNALQAALGARFDERKYREWPAYPFAKDIEDLNNTLQKLNMPEQCKGIIRNVGLYGGGHVEDHTGRFPAGVEGAILREVTDIAASSKHATHLTLFGGVLRFRAPDLRGTAEARRPPEFREQSLPNGDTVLGYIPRGWVQTRDSMIQADLVFGNPGILERKSARQTLEAFHSAATTVCDQFEQFVVKTRE